MGIVQALASALALIDHLFQAYQGSTMVANKVAKLSQADQDKHAQLVAKAMQHNADSKASLDEIRKLVA